jgi:hypothetical protein
MDKLNQFLTKNRCGVFLTVNQHRDYYQSAADAIAEININERKIHKDIEKIMIEKNQIIELQFYPDTPIGSYTLYHYDIDLILDEALQILNNKSDGRNFIKS